MKYDNNSIDINYIIYKDYTKENRKLIIKKTKSFMSKYFTKMKYFINFLDNYEHDYLKKFKIIVKKDNTDNEPVGGFYKVTL